MAAEALWSATDIRLEHVFRLLSLSAAGTTPRRVSSA
jgi:hypothetical protein